VRSSGRTAIQIPGDGVDVVTGCLEIFLLSSSLENVQAVQPPATLSTLFSQMGKRNTLIDSRFANVLNSHNVQVGELVGDGLRIKLQRSLLRAAGTQPVLVRGVQICIEARRAVTDVDARFTEYDLGVLQGSAVVPQNAAVFLVKSGLFLSVCATQDVVVKVDPATQRLNATITYYPIMRMPAWESEDGKGFDTWLTVVLYVAASLYALVAFVSVATAASMVWVLPTLKPTMVIPACIALFTALRAVYFYLLVVGVFGDNPTMTEYVLVELPTLLFFCAFTMLVWAWCEICWSASKLSSGGAVSCTRLRVTLLVLVLLNATLLCLFILFTGLYQAMPDFEVQPAVNAVTCGVRTTSTARSGESQYPNNQSKEQFVVSVVYHTIIVAFTLSVALGLLIYGWRLFFLLRETEMQKSLVKLKVFFVANVCAFGFVLHCAYVMTLTVEDNFDTTPFTLVFIFLAELIPCLVISMFFFPYQQIATKSSTMTASSSFNPSTPTPQRRRAT